jgi:hypothetical protein
VLFRLPFSIIAIRKFDVLLLLKLDDQIEACNFSVEDANKTQGIIEVIHYAYYVNPFEPSSAKES